MHIRTSLLSLGETPQAMTEGHLSHLQLDLNPPSLCSRTSALPLPRPFRLPRSEKTQIVSTDRVIGLSLCLLMLLLYWLSEVCSQAFWLRLTLGTACQMPRPSHGVLVPPLS